MNWALVGARQEWPQSRQVMVSISTSAPSKVLRSMSDWMSSWALPQWEHMPEVRLPCWLGEGPQAQAIRASARRANVIRM